MKCIRADHDDQEDAEEEKNEWGDPNSMSTSTVVSSLVTPVCGS